MTDRQTLAQRGKRLEYFTTAGVIFPRKQKHATVRNKIEALASAR